MPIGLAGETLGRRLLDAPTAARLDGSRRLLDGLVALLGPVLRTVHLRRAVDERRARAHHQAVATGTARREAVAAFDAERRALERNLHDGAQHHLVALQMVVGLLEHELATGQLAAARDRLAHITRLLNVTSDGLSSTASGILPLPLVTRGVAGALVAEFPPGSAVRLEVDPVAAERRYPFPVEVAVFFTCLEAAGNARKHAPTARVGIQIAHTYRGLAFTVVDDGPGFDVDAVRPGSGLSHLANRIAGVGGQLELRSEPGQGTTVRGFVPI